MNKCKILRNLMHTLDTIVVEGTNNATIQHVKSILSDYCEDGTSFEAPKVDDFFTDDVVRQWTINSVMKDLNKNDMAPGLDAIPVGTGTLLFALHEYQHRYHEDDDPLLVDGLSTLESRARGCIEDAISNGGWSFVKSAMTRVYQEAVAGRGRKMVYAIFEVRRALQEWLPEFYVEIFTNES